MLAPVLTRLIDPDTALTSLLIDIWIITADMFKDNWCCLLLVTKPYLHFQEVSVTTDQLYTVSHSPSTQCITDPSKLMKFSTKFVERNTCCSSTANFISSLHFAHYRCRLYATVTSAHWYVGHVSTWNRRSNLNDSSNTWIWRCPWFHTWPTKNTSHTG